MDFPIRAIVESKVNASPNSLKVNASPNSLKVNASPNSLKVNVSPNSLRVNVSPNSLKSLETSLEKILPPRRSQVPSGAF